MTDNGKMSFEELDSKERNDVVYAGPTLATANMYKRVVGGWRQFYPASFRAFGPVLTSRQLDEIGVWR